MRCGPVQGVCMGSSSEEYDFVPFTEEETNSSIPEIFERRTRNFPDRIAIETADGSSTYRSLKTAAHRIARAVWEELGDGNEPVAIWLSDIREALAAIFGILKAGKIYLPLDITLPPARPPLFFPGRFPCPPDPGGHAHSQLGASALGRSR